MRVLFLRSKHSISGSNVMNDFPKTRMDKTFGHASKFLLFTFRSEFFQLAKILFWVTKKNSSNGLHDCYACRTVFNQ